MDVVPEHRRRDLDVEHLTAPQRRALAKELHYAGCQVRGHREEVKPGTSEEGFELVDSPAF